MIEVNRSDMVLFFETLFRYCDDGGYVALRAFDSSNKAWGEWPAPRIANGRGDVINAAIELAEAAANSGENIVFCPPVATFKSAKTATEKDIFNGPALSIDCDVAPARAREIIENTLGPATIAVASGGLWVDPETGETQEKVHLHWRLTEPTRVFADHIKLKEARRLATILVGADASGVPLVHPLRWPGSLHRKAEPRLARIVSLRENVEIELGDALELLYEAVAALPPGSGSRDGNGYDNPERQPSRFGAEAEALDIISALAVIPNDEKNWKRWSDIGMAVWHASRGSEAGFAAYLAWSSKFDGFDPATTRQRWNGIAGSPPGAIGAGTLFHRARDAWPGWEKPSDLQQRRDNDPGEPPAHIAAPDRDTAKAKSGNGAPPGAEPGGAAKTKKDAKPRAPDNQGWRSKLILNEKKKPRILLANAVTVLREAPEWRGLILFDEFHNRAVLRGAPPWTETPIDEPWSDLYDNLTTDWMQRRGVFVGPELVGRAVWTVAHDHPFHPVRDYLEGCRWDGVPRLDTWTSTYLGVVDTEYSRAVGARWMISGVARVMRPGCKADCSLVLEGHQGYLKSTALRALSDPWFTDDLGEFGTKDAAQQLAGVWIVELSELDSYTRSDVAKAKSFMSRATDRFRPPYGTHPIAQPRQSIFGGTVNHNEYLRDETGGRRFWPVACTRIDIDRLTADRDQLWAEARDRFLADEHWWLDTLKLNALATREQQHRYQPDAWDGVIHKYIEHRNEVTVEEILKEVLSIRVGEWKQAEQNRVARSLRLAGWVRKQKQVDGDRGWLYFRPAE
jgi:predicted P-loop ATPase